MSFEPDKDSILYQEPKTKAEEEQERRERNVRMLRLTKGIGIFTRWVGGGITRLGSHIVSKCDDSEYPGHTNIPEVRTMSVGGMVIRSVGRGVTKLGGGVTKACEKTLDTPENRAVVALLPIA